MSLKNKTVAPPEKPDIRPLSSENLVERYHGRISCYPGNGEVVKSARFLRALEIEVQRAGVSGSVNLEVGSF
jgi:hypothetical protein